MLPLSIVTLGHVHAEDLEPLTRHFSRLEQLILDVNPRDPIAKHRPELHRAVDAATADWVLIVREREKVGEKVAEEIARSIDVPQARAFRIRTTPFYQGRELRIGIAGDVRLFDKRRFDRTVNEELRVDGPTLALANGFSSMTFASAAEHRDYLRASGATTHSTIRRALIFLRDAIGSRALDRNTLRYIWTEAGFDRA